MQADDFLNTTASIPPSSLRRIRLACRFFTFDLHPPPLPPPRSQGRTECPLGWWGSLFHSRTPPEASCVEDSLFISSIIRPWKGRLLLFAHAAATACPALWRRGQTRARSCGGVVSLIGEFFVTSQEVCHWSIQSRPPIRGIECRS